MKWLAVWTVCWICPVIAAPVAGAPLRAGAAAVDITPLQLPVIVNGGLVARRVSDVKTRLHARAIVLDDGRERLAMVVVDSCMTPRPLLDEVKQRAAQRTGIRFDRMLISATHTHSAPSIMDNMVAADQTYLPYLREKIAEAVARAEANLEPARVGWASVQAAKFTALRRWILRPDRIQNDVFGNPTVRATMHAATNWDHVTGPSGPEDPELTLLSLQSLDGRPIALLANFSMHYFSGEQGLSADYYGLFCEGLKSRLGEADPDGQRPFVAAMSHGCSGDIWRRDYALPPEDRYEPTIETYATELLDLTMDAYQRIEHQGDVDLAMAEARLPMKYRVPDAQRLEWARRIVAELGDREPTDQVQAYAREQLILHDQQTTEVVVQAIRIGDMAIATSPTETYALTGLKIKLQSPLAKTMVIDLANGADGYIPPPEQHQLGGYNTWAMRGAGLEIAAEPKITETALALLERVAARPRRVYRQGRGPAAAAILASRPVAYWRLDEFEGFRARDASGADHDARYEPGMAFFLEGPRAKAFCLGAESNRAVHFAGGRLRARLSGLNGSFSLVMSFWNGMPVTGRAVTGWMFSRGRDYGGGAAGEHLGLGGSACSAGKLIYLQGSAPPLAGRTTIRRWTWYQVALVRTAGNVRLYLNGDPNPEIDARIPGQAPPWTGEWFFGGRSDRRSSWEGRLDEIALFDRSLSAAEIATFARGN